MMSGYDIFRECWDGEKYVEALSYDGQIRVKGDAKFVREVIGQEPQMFSVTVETPFVDVNLPDVMGG